MIFNRMTVYHDNGHNCGYIKEGRFYPSKCGLHRTDLTEIAQMMLNMERYCWSRRLINRIKGWFK